MTPDEARPYRIPAGVCQTETRVSNSRFVTTIAPAKSVDEARGTIARIRLELPSASHYVHAYRIGYGNSVIEGMSDDGEPSGTAGPPTLAVLRGTDVGDIVVVTARYFGGTKLGTGGLVRAYSGAARAGLQVMQTELRVARQLLALTVRYADYEPVRRLLARHQGKLIDENFEGMVTMRAEMPTNETAAFTRSIAHLTGGRVKPTVLDNYA